MQEIKLYPVAGTVRRLFFVLLLCGHGASFAEEQQMPGEVVRSTFTSSVEQREPVDTIMSLACDQGQVYYFTELRNLEGHVVTHRWEYDGAVMADIKINVDGPRWRAWSSKRLMPDWLGEWSVQVFDDTGRVLARDSFVCMSPMGDRVDEADAGAPLPDEQATMPAVNSIK